MCAASPPKEALPGRTRMRELAVHRRHHTLLVVVLRLDAETGRFAYRRTPPIRTDDERCADAMGVGDQPHAVLLESERSKRLTADLSARCDEGVERRPLHAGVGDDMAKVGFTELCGIEGDRSVAPRRLRARPHVHPLVRAEQPGNTLERFPSTGRTRDPLAGARQSHDAQVRLRIERRVDRRRQAGFDEQHAAARAAASAEQRAEQRADRTATDDGDIELATAHITPAFTDPPPGSNPARDAEAARRNPN
jgi:hypothetical protein